MKKIISIVGTRPEAIKMCPLLRLLEGCRGIESKLVLSGQHRELCEEVIREQKINIDYNLAVMCKNQTLLRLSEKIMRGAYEVFEYESPDLLLVHGDTTTAFASALAAFYMKIPIGHVEAGLRTYDPLAPYPEEFNRHAIDVMSSLCFAPTEEARKNLISEGVAGEKIFVTGNTGIDALYYSLGGAELPTSEEAERTVIITLHRRETEDKNMREVMAEIRRIIEKTEHVRAIFPVHPSPRVRESAEAAFLGCDKITLCEPLSPREFHRLLAKSYLIVSDSGGIQEEAATLGIPLLLVRETTERPEAAECGNILVSGTSPKKVGQNLEKLLSDRLFHTSLAKKSSVFGDGRAAERIFSIICEKFSADFINNM